MSILTVAVTFTKSGGQPATGETLSNISLYLTSQNKDTGARAVVWDGTQNPTEEVTNVGAYTRRLSDADLNTYNYFAAAEYTGATVMDQDWITGSIGVEPCVQGPGASANVYTLTKADGVTPVPGATVWATTDVTGDIVVASGVTDDAGQVTFYLTSGVTYYIWRRKPGYRFANPDIEVAA